MFTNLNLTNNQSNQRINWNNRSFDRLIIGLILNVIYSIYVQSNLIIQRIIKLYDLNEEEVN